MTRPDWDEALCERFRRACRGGFDLDDAEDAEMMACELTHVALDARAAEVERLEAERDGVRAALAEADNYHRALRSDEARRIENQTAEDVAAFVVDRLNWDRSNDAALYAIAEAIRSGAWRKVQAK